MYIFSFLFLDYTPRSVARQRYANVLAASVVVFTLVIAYTNQNVKAVI